MKPESEWTPSTDECPRPEWWHSADEDATEQEVLLLLGGLVRALQPEFVLETGTYLGHGAAVIGEALKKNGHGRLVTLEVDEKRAQTARFTTGCLPVEVVNKPSLEYDCTESIDFAFFDSAGGNMRELEFRRFYPKMHERTIVAFHDTSQRHKIIRVQVERLEHEGLLKAVFVPTPRGVAICEVLV